MEQLHLEKILLITILSDENSWINDYIPPLITNLKRKRHKVQWLHNCEKIKQGDIVFYLGCSQIVPKLVLSRNKHNLVIHESALPLGKGWSPLTWQILEGKNEIPITLFEAVEKVDSGPIYLTDTLNFNGTELVDELRQIQAEVSIKLCVDFVKQYPEIINYSHQQKGQSTFYPRRTSKDSMLDPDKTIREQFNLLRVVDNNNYPAFFVIEGETYIVKIEKNC